jgi:hypothetical protein
MYPVDTHPEDTYPEDTYPVDTYPVDTYPVDQSTGYLSSNHLKMVKKITGFEPV